MACQKSHVFICKRHFIFIHFFFVKSWNFEPCFIIQLPTIQGESYGSQAIHFIVQTCLPQSTSVSTPKSICPYFQIFYLIFFCGCTINQSKQNSVKNEFFDHSSCKNSVSTHIFNYTDALHSDNFILFTSVKVVLNRRPQNTFSSNKAPSVLLSLMPTHPFLNGCCLVDVCFLSFVHSSSSSSVSWSYLSPTASDSNLPYRKMANICKVLMPSRCSMA